FKVREPLDIVISISRPVSGLAKIVSTAIPKQLDPCRPTAKRYPFAPSHYVVKDRPTVKRRGRYHLNGGQAAWRNTRAQRQNSLHRSCLWRRPKNSTGTLRNTRRELRHPIGGFHDPSCPGVHDDEHDAIRKSPLAKDVSPWILVGRPPVGHRSVDCWACQQ